jgi:hypothetical protein
VLVVHPGANVHVHAHQVQAMGLDARQRLVQLFVPDAMLAVFAAGIGLAAVAMAEARVDADPHAVAGRALTQLVQHVDGAGVDFDLRRHHAFQGGAVQRVAGQHHAGRVTVNARAGGEGPFHLTQRHGVQHQAMGAHQAQHMQVRVGFLGETYGVEHVQLLDTIGDGAGVVCP